MLLQIEPVFDNEEARAVADLVMSGSWLTEYARTAELERAIEGFLSVEECIMVPNGTLALYATYQAMGVRQGVEVIVPAFTMLATANAAHMLGAHVRFVDIDPETLCIDLDKLDAMTWPVYSHFGVIAAVDLNGRAPNMDRLRVIAKRHNALVLEDAAQAFGSKWNGQNLGTFGDAAIFSFSPHKIISSGQGGCVVTNNVSTGLGVRMFKNFGKPQGGGRHEHLMFGTNLRYTDLQAAILLEQLKKVNERLVTKVMLYDWYVDRLADVDGLELIPLCSRTGAVPWYMDILTDARDDLAVFLQKEGIQTQHFYPPVHLCPPYVGLDTGSFPVAESVSRRGLWLPSSVNLTEKDIDNVCAQIRRFFG